MDALTGEPYGPPIADPRAEHAGIPALRTALNNDKDDAPLSEPVRCAC